MATAEQTGVMALARLWWRQIYVNDVSTLNDFEIGRQSLYLTKAWDATAGEVMVGVGDQLNPSGDLFMYSDFGRADFALQVSVPCLFPHGSRGQHNVVQLLSSQCNYDLYSVVQAVPFWKLLVFVRQFTCSLILPRRFR
jgi:hypothetical protein